MRKIALLLSLCLLLSLVAGCGNKDAGASGGAGGVTITLRERSQYTTGAMAEAIAQLDASGAGVTLSSEVVPWVDEQTELIQFKGGSYADLSWNTNSDVGWMSYMGLIQPVDWLTELESFRSIPENILRHITYQGHVYAIPNRATVTAMYTNRQALLTLGWSGEQIETLPALIESGAWTLADLTALAQEAVEKGVVKYGLITEVGIGWHSLTALASSFGAYYYDAEQDTLILDKEAWTGYLSWWQDAIGRNVVQKSQINMSAQTVSRIVADGEALFYIDHEPYQNLYLEKQLESAAFEEWFFSSFLISKIPTGIEGQPGTSMLKLYTMFVSSKTDETKLAYIKEAVNLLYAPESELQTNAYLSQFCLPVTQDAWQNEALKDNRYLSAMSAFVEGATTWPTHPYFPYYLMAHNKAIQKMIVSGITAGEAYEMLREELSYNVEAGELAVRE